MVENQGMGSGDDILRERWYNMENSYVERQSLSHLDELDSSL